MAQSQYLFIVWQVSDDEKQTDAFDAQFKQQRPRKEQQEKKAAVKVWGKNLKKKQTVIVIEISAAN